MITKTVQNLFDFIDYLYSQTDYLLSKQPLIDEVNELISKKNELRPQQNYKDKLQHDKLKTELEQKFDIVESEIINPIKEKIKYFDIADIETPIVNLTAQSDLFELQRNFAETDLKFIKSANSKYLEFRNRTNFHYYLQRFFNDLDRDLKEFFDYFKDVDFSEFDNLEKTTISINLSDEQGIAKAVRKLLGNSNNLHFETFSEFLKHFESEVENYEFSERYFEVKRIIDQQKIKLENIVFESDIDEVISFAKSGIKDFKNYLEPV